MKRLQPYFLAAKDFLDTRLFPLIVSYTTSRAHILVLLALWIALICGGSFTAFELVGGNYTNGLSALVSCIVLLQSMKHHTETRKLRSEVKKQHEETHKKLDVIHENVALPERKAKVKAGQ
ncbi:MAG: hypothetical protein ACXWQ5_00120 [Ktedonobacterales bacterium]